MVLEELLIFLHRQETEEEQQQKGQGPTCQCAQDVLFPELSGNYQVGKWRITWFKLLYLVGHRFAPTTKKLKWCPWRTLLCLLCACHCIQLVSLPMRKEVSEKPVQTIIPRNELITEQRDEAFSQGGHLRGFLKT